MGIWRIEGETINYIYAKIPKLHIIIRGAHWCDWVFLIGGVLMQEGVVYILKKRHWQIFKSRGQLTRGCLL
jgi:hypothetical protein